MREGIGMGGVLGLFRKLFRGGFIVPEQAV
jgi:hypothetical protein